MSVTVEAEIADSDLMLRFQSARDFSAFESLFERHKRGLLSFLKSLTGDAATAEDLSQHCWLKIIEIAKEQRYSADRGASFRTFLYTLGRNRFLDEHVRRHEVSRRASVSAEQALEQSTPSAAAEHDPMALLATEQGHQVLQQAMQALPVEQREVVALWAAGGSIAEIVAITQAPRDTVLSRKKYGLSKLKAALATGATDGQAAEVRS